MMQSGLTFGQIRAAASHVPRFKPEFDFEIEWHDTYDSLFSRKSAKGTSGMDRLLDHALVQGRLLLSAEGGQGKTSILRRTYRQAVRERMWPVLVDMHTWSPAIADRWRSSGTRVAQVEVLLSELGQPRTDEVGLFTVPDGRSRVLLVDGINEIDASTAREVLAALDDYAARNPLACVVVTDRLVRRDIRADRWALATIAPLSAAEIARRAGSAALGNDLLKTAFFLDIAAHETVGSSSSAAAIRVYIDRHGGLDDDSVTRAAGGAFHAYLALGEAHAYSRTFDRSVFDSLATPAVRDRLIESGLLMETAGLLYFRHHLFHDYLASMWLVSDESLWTPASFDALTFRASSFDALALGLEQLADPDRADLFVTRIYDWNFYAVSYALWKAQSQRVCAVTDGTTSLLLTMLAEKIWDPIRRTAQLVTDGLRLFSTPMVERLLSATSLAGLVQLVADDPEIGKERADWRALFTTPPGGVASDQMVSRVADPESLIGWTVANVLRRATLADVRQTHLRDLAAHSTGTVRWRIAHVLGAHPSRENMAFLFALLDDGAEYEWARYGAVRSLVESASQSSALRDSIAEGIISRLPRLVEDRLILAELEKAILLKDPPPDWAQHIGPIVDELWATAPSWESQERWRHLGYEIQHARS